MKMVQSGWNQLVKTCKWTACALLAGTGLIGPLPAQTIPTIVTDGVITLNSTNIHQLATLPDDQLATFLGLLAGLPTSDTSGGQNFYSLQNPGWPPLPLNIHNLPVWNINGFNLVNDVGYDYSAPLFSPMGGHVMDDSGLSPGGDGSGGYGGNLITYTWDTNQLWLNLTNVSDGTSYLNLFNATNRVYAIWSTTNLPGGWQVETEVWPTNPACMPFTVPTLNRANLFLRAEDWTGVTNGDNITPDWWFWEYFGTLALMDTNVDTQNDHTLLYDYQHDLDPNIISFTMLSTNQYVNAYSSQLQLSVTAGVPSYFTVLVDDTNYVSTNWLAYNSTNITVNLGTTQGWHQVFIGLKGLPPDAYQTWESTRLKLDISPPSLTLTSPTNSTGTQSIIQVQGYSSESLSSLSYDLTNAAGLVTNQQALILSRYYDTNTLEFTTNFFQCFDVPLTNGENTIIFHATDLAGNTTTTNVTCTLDYSNATNPPTIQLGWPQAGAQISGGSFTWRGWISDPTAQVSAQIVDTNGTTNVINGNIGRAGDFWISGLPLSGGTNNLTLTATDAAGNTSITNIAVVQSSLVLTITSAGLGQSVSGTISDTNVSDYTIWVNGTMATNNGDGTWTAQDPHLTLDTPSVQVRAIPNTDNGGYGGGQ